MKRACFLLRVRPERLEEYLDRHRAVWPEMLEALARCGWHDYSLFHDGQGLVVGCFTSDDPERAIAAMSREDVNRRWQAEMAPYLVPDPNGSEAPALLDQYFFTA